MRLVKAAVVCVALWHSGGGGGGERIYQNMV